MLKDRETEVAELGGLVAAGASAAPACNTGREPLFHKIDGSF